MSSDLNIIAVGDAFVRVLRDWLTQAEFDEVVRRNTDVGIYSAPDGCCASHDFCDANMAMDAAFRDVLSREPNVTGDEPTDCELWNEAWSYAKRTQLTRQA